MAPHDMGMIRAPCASPSSRTPRPAAAPTAGASRRCCATRARTVAVHAFDPDDGDDAIDAAAAAAAAERPDRLAVAGGDGSIGPVAAHAAALGPAARGHPDRHRERLRPRARPPARPRGGVRARGATRRASGRSTCSAPANGRSSTPRASGSRCIAARHARPLKRPLGPLRLRASARSRRRAHGAAAALPRQRPTAPRSTPGAAWQVIVAGTGAFGGGSELDDADPSDRLVDVAVLEAGPRVDARPPRVGHARRRPDGPARRPPRPRHGDRPRGPAGHAVQRRRRGVPRRAGALQRPRRAGPRGLPPVTGPRLSGRRSRTRRGARRTRCAPTGPARG